MKQAPATTAEEQLAQLRARYPRAFRTPKPLALETHQDLVCRMSPRNYDLVVLPSVVRAALDLWTRSPDYLSACTVGAVRYNLNGWPAGVVTAREAAYAVSN